MKTIGPIALMGVVLVALALGHASVTGSAQSGSAIRPVSAGQRAPVEGPESVQDLLKVAWLRSRAAEAQKPQDAIIREWLAPLTAVVVSARAGAQNLDPYQVTENLVRQTVERQLRRDGIEVLDTYTAAGSGAGRHSPLTVATLAVEILGMVRSDGNVAAVCIFLKLQQEVAQVAADTPTFARADTWQRAAFALVAPQDIRPYCLGSLDDLVANFVKDWRDAHRKRPEEEQAQKG